MFQILQTLCRAAAAKLSGLLRPSAASIGVIGGADGPTVVFVTTRAIPWWETMFCVLFVLGVAAFLIWNRRRK